MKLAARPGALTSRISPPSSFDSSRLMARPRPVPPYLRLVRAVGLLERLEDDLLLVGEMPMPVSVTAKATTVVGAVQLLVVRAPAGLGRLDRQCHLAVVRELEGVGEQVLQDLLQALDVGDHRLRQARVEADEEIDALRLRHVAEGALARSAADRRSAARSHRPTTVPDSIFDRSRMSLISVSRSLPDEWIVLANSTCLRVDCPRVFWHS